MGGLRAGPHVAASRGQGLPLLLLVWVLLTPRTGVNATGLQASERFPTPKHPRLRRPSPHPLLARGR